ncbi:hypothetical protein CY35_15G052300 [Sphagnum magellanicum]|nr:hypothetical protein CY35_15G052300 [Sphagnum magellanicum]
MSYTCALGTFSRYTRYYSTQAPFQARYAQIHQQDEYPTQYVSLPCPESGMKQWSLSSAPPKGFPKVQSQQRACQASSILIMESKQIFQRP